VRDAAILHLYRKAGVARLLMGIESTDERTLQRIRKGSTQAIDREAIRLLRRHGIISMAACVTGFAQESDADYWRTLRQILEYDPDQIQLLYATPHRWTAFAEEQASRKVIQTDLSRWDYKHQVLKSEQVPNWRVLFWMKLIEAVSQLRPKSVLRVLAHPDPGFRSAMRWYYSIGRQVWPYELWHWLFYDRRVKWGPKVAEFLGLVGAHEVQQAVAHRERQQVVDDVKHDEFPDLSPDFGFVSRADVQQEGIEHFAGVVPGQEALETAGHSRD
jgi:anaerobic magnesium-protoporphyrin IX monomethyl ester cyclase